MSISISLILCVSGDFWQSNAVVKNTLEKSGVSFQLLVYNSLPNDLRLDALYKDIASVYVTSNEFPNQVSALNHLLSNATSEYVVVVPEEVVLSENWLVTTYFDLLNLDQAGCLTIPLNRDFINLRMSEALTKDFDLTTVFCSENTEHYGIQLYSKEVVNLLGAYDESLSTYLALKQYTFRASMLGYKSYYSIGNSCIAFNDPIVPNKVELQKYNDGLNLFNKLKNPFLQLFELSAFEEIAYHALDTLVASISTDCQKFFSKNTGKFGVALKVLNNETIQKIQKYCIKYGFTYSISSISQQNTPYTTSYLIVVLNA